MCDFGGCGSMVNSSITQVAPQHAVILVEIAHYIGRTVARLYSKAGLSRSSTDFTFVRAKTARSAMCIRAWKFCDIN